MTRKIANQASFDVIFGCKSCDDVITNLGFGSVWTLFEKKIYLYEFLIII